MIEAVTVCLRNYFNFSGRAARPEFWWFVLFVVIASWLLSIADYFVYKLTDLSAFNPYSTTVIDDETIWYDLTGGLLTEIITLALFFPQLSVSARRLHDRDHSAWWLLLIFVPILGWLVLLVWYVLPGTPGDNRFGPDPRSLP
ncbi:DUF805 domain-containing protein [Mesorhizobium sp. KR9-304]|uniref:DUF805 domain-containing protein n=1 Tax=Mesorhizobium sp. KR9-304 TaxID=3156614 RepID=UPI0032B30F4C